MSENLMHPIGSAAPLRHTRAVRSTPWSFVPRYLSIAIAVVALAACGSSNRAPAQPAPSAAADDPTCPVLVAGTSVTVEDTDGGAAFVFVTTGDAAAVRTRARALADAHNAHHAKMEAPAAGAADPHAGHGGHADHNAHAGHDAHAGHGAAAPAAAAPAGKHTMGTMISAHSTAAVTELPNGARVAFTAHDPAALQSELRMHAQHLGGGTCEM